MKRIDTIAIVGVGLIGGSIGLAVKRRKLTRRVVGVGRSAASLAVAKRRGAIDWGTCDAAEGVAEADLVVLALPLSDMADAATAVAARVSTRALVTDVGSVKGEVVRRMERIFAKRGVYVGSHPMAGSERSGVRFADANLFEGATCVVTRTGRTRPGALKAVTSFWRALGAGVRVLTPVQHDRLIASVSHVPHVCASALAASTDVRAVPFAAGGFRDMTRIAASDPEMWADICLMNQQWVIRQTARVSRRLQSMTRALARGDRRALVRCFRQGQRTRIGLE